MQRGLLQTAFRDVFLVPSEEVTDLVEQRNADLVAEFAPVLTREEPDVFQPEAKARWRGREVVGCRRSLEKPEHVLLGAIIEVLVTGHGLEENGDLANAGSHLWGERAERPSDDRLGHTEKSRPLYHQGKLTLSQREETGKRSE